MPNSNVQVQEVTADNLLTAITDDDVCKAAAPLRERATACLTAGGKVLLLDWQSTDKSAVGIEFNGKTVKVAAGGRVYFTDQTFARCDRLLLLGGQSGLQHRLLVYVDKPAS